jgi:FkbM family methyltransferase
MKISIRKIYSLILLLVKFNRLEIEKGLKSKIRATWFKVFILKRYDSQNRIANIVGFNVNYLNYRALVSLFIELFLGYEYYFVSKNDNPYIIDCGSNIGMSIFYFKMLYPNSQILGFEPEEETFSCLEKNVKNNFMNSVVIHKVALSNKEGIIDFYYDPENVGSLNMSTKQKKMSKQNQKVKAILLSKHINKDVDFLKIDIEGSELEVLEELSNAGKLNYVSQMVIEYHHHIESESDIFSRMLRILEDAGYGYQIESHPGWPIMRQQYQDILIYGYRK